MDFCNCIFAAISWCNQLTGFITQSVLKVPTGLIIVSGKKEGQQDANKALWHQLYITRTKKGADGPSLAWKASAVGELKLGNV